MEPNQKPAKAPAWHVGRDLAVLSPFIGCEEHFLMTSKTSKIFSPALRLALLMAQEMWCAYCYEPIEPDHMQVDHVIPVSLGGGNNIENLVACCAFCNSTKGNRDIEYLRTAIGLQNSELSGIITASQANQLIVLGVKLPIDRWKFRFEEYVEAMLGGDW